MGPPTSVSTCHGGSRLASLGGHLVHGSVRTTVKVARVDLRGTGSATEFTDRPGLTGRSGTRVQRSWSDRDGCRGSSGYRLHGLAGKEHRKRTRSSSLLDRGWRLPPAGAGPAPPPGAVEHGVCRESPGPGGVGKLAGHAGKLGPPTPSFFATGGGDREEGHTLEP